MSVEIMAGAGSPARAWNVFPPRVAWKDGHIIPCDLSAYPLPVALFDGTSQAALFPKVHDGLPGSALDTASPKRRFESMLWCIQDLSGVQDSLRICGLLERANSLHDLFPVSPAQPFPIAPARHRVQWPWQPPREQG